MSTSRNSITHKKGRKKKRKDEMDTDRYQDGTVPSHSSFVSKTRTLHQVKQQTDKAIKRNKKRTLKKRTKRSKTKPKAKAKSKLFTSV